jgi:hypothetical protein
MMRFCPFNGANLMIDMYEILGYVASVLVAVSLTQSSVLRLRIINLLGAVAFTVYGVLISAYPVAVVNFFIVLINLYYLRGMMNTHEFFQIVDVNAESAFLRAFIAHYAEDMQRFYPSLDVEKIQPDVALIVLRNMVPAGVYLAHRDNAQGDDALFVDVDYVTPQYRDFKTGRFIYDANRTLFDKRGIRRIFSTITPDADYLKKMGFHSAQDNLLVKEL